MISRPPDGDGQPEPPPGAQSERTVLAWQRTILGAVLGALLASMTAVRVGAPWLAVAVAGLSIYLAVRMVLPAPLAGRRAGTTTSMWSALVRTAGAVAVLGLLGASIALVGALGLGS